MRRWVWLVLGVAIIGGTAFGVNRWNKSRPKPEPRYDGKTAAEWTALLAETDATSAVAALRSQGESALPVLLEARKSTNLRAHRRAIELLIAAGAPAVEPLIDQLSHAGARVELALVRLGPRAIPGLEKALGGPNGYHAARVLGLIGTRAVPAIPALVGLVQDGGADRVTRVAAIHSLGRIGAELGPEALTRPDNPVVGALVAALASDDLRLAAARALAGVCRAAKAAIPDLARLAKEKDAELSAAACQALGATLDPSAAIPLSGQLSREGRPAQAAALALARLGPATRPAMPALIDALRKDKDEGQLARAVLERLGETAVPYLVEALENKDDGIRRGAAEVLALLGPRAPTSAKALAARLADESPAVALAAAQALVRVDPAGSSAVVAPLGKLLASKDVPIAAGAAFVLADIGSVAKPLTPELLATLAGKDETRAARAAALLGGIRPPDKAVLTALEAGLKGPTLVQKVCIDALGRHGDAAKDSIPALRKCLDDVQSRPDAALALVRISRAESALAVDKLAPDIASRDIPSMAALAAMEPPPAEALPALRPLLGDVRVGGLALLSLSRMDAATRAKAIPDLLALLGSNLVALQTRAAEMLQELGPLAAPGLLQALKSPSTRTRIGAMMALRSSTFIDAVKDRTPLLDALEGEDTVAREFAGEALAVLGVTAEDDIRRLTELLPRPEADLRRYAVRILLAGSAKTDQPLDPNLAECLFDPDEGVRFSACLPRLPRKSPLYEVASLDDGSIDVRVAAALALRKTMPSTPESLENLKRLIRIAEPRALGEIANAITSPNLLDELQLRSPLEHITRGDDLSERIGAFTTLARLDKSSAPPCERFLLSVVVGWDAHARIEAALALRHPSPPAVAILRQRLQVEREIDVRAAIDRALAK
jgi:HEAT repeat protein